MDSVNLSGLVEQIAALVKKTLPGSRDDKITLSAPVSCQALLPILCLDSF